MKTLSRKESFPAPAKQVFKSIDDLGVTGMHMTESSGMMMGSKLSLQDSTPILLTIDNLHHIFHDNQQ